MGANVKKKGDIDRTNAVSVFFLVVAETVRVICMEAQSFSPACFCFPLQLPKYPSGGGRFIGCVAFFFVQTKRATAQVKTKYDSRLRREFWMKIESSGQMRQADCVSSTGVTGFRVNRPWWTENEST